MTSIHRLFSALAILAVLSVPIARGQLLLSGHTTGWFDDLNQANTTVTNAPDGTSASFFTGIPITGSTQSSIEFTSVDFTNVGSGEPIQVGLFDIVNGRTLLGSGASTANFHVGLELTEPEGLTLAITSILFHIDHTPNLPNSLIPDSFAVSFEQPDPILIDDTLVQFTIHVDPLEFPVGENAMIQKGDITVSFTPVPEPSTYAIGGSLLVLGLATYRRIRERRTRVTPRRLLLE
jgi:hypothetical protein